MVSIQNARVGPAPARGSPLEALAVSGEGTGRAPVHPPARLRIRGRPEAEAESETEAEAEACYGEGVSYYTCQVAANTRPRNRRDSVTEGGKSVTRSPRDRSLARLLVFALIVLKQRQSTSTAIFLLPQKPPLRQTPVSSFSAMPPASARWEMRAGEPAAPRLPLRLSRVSRKLQFPACLATHAPFLDTLIGAEDDPGERTDSNEMKLEPSDWRRLDLLSAFYSCNWQGAPGALIFFSLSFFFFFKELE